MQDDLLGWGLLVGAGISLLTLGFSIGADTVQNPYDKKTKSSSHNYE